MVLGNTHSSDRLTSVPQKIEKLKIAEFLFMDGPAIRLGQAAPVILQLAGASHPISTMFLTLIFTLLPN